MVLRVRYYIYVILNSQKYPPEYTIKVLSKDTSKEKSYSNTYTIDSKLKSAAKIEQILVEAAVPRIEETYKLLYDKDPKNFEPHINIFGMSDVFIKKANDDPNYILCKYDIKYCKKSYMEILGMINMIDDEDKVNLAEEKKKDIILFEI